MICETYNWILNILYWCFGSVWHPVNEVSVIQIAIVSVVFVVFMLAVSWWLVPLMRGIDKLDNTKFHCEIDKN